MNFVPRNLYLDMNLHHFISIQKKKQPYDIMDLEAITVVSRMYFVADFNESKNFKLLKNFYLATKN